MKDYTFDLEDKKEFILNYEIIDNDIIINFANGTKYMVPATKTNEDFILRKMKEQVIESKEAEEKLAERVASKSIMSSAALIIGSAGSIIVGYIIAATTHDLSIPLVLAASAPGIAGGIIGFTYNSSCKNDQRLLEDIRKNKMFLDNASRIKEALANKNVLANVNDRTKELSNEQNLNLNTIDKYSISDLEEVIDYVGLEDSFKFDQFEEVQEQKTGKKRTRKR